MSREWRPSLDPELVTEARKRADDVEPWRPAPGKITRTMRMASKMSQAEVHRRAHGEPGDEIADVLARLDASSGAPLPAPLADELGGALGRDLSDVRVHTDGVAAAAARDLAAEAFAIGDDIYFAAGAYEPHSERGRHLIAHEVAHTAQQQGASRAAGDAIRVSEPGDASELEADRFADAFVAREPAPHAQPAPAPAPSPAPSAAPAPAAEPARIVPPTALSMITPVQRRLIARETRFPIPQVPTNPGPAPAPGPSPAPAPGPPMKECKGVKLDVGSTELFPAKTWNEPFTILPATVVPIAKGLVMVDIVPVTYGVDGQYNLSAGASGSLGPATLNASVVYVDCETAEELGIGGNSPVDDGAHGNSGESDLDKVNNAGLELWGNANMDFSASASAWVAGGASLKAYAGIADIFKAGGEGGISVAGSVNANMTASPRITMRWKQGVSTVEDISMKVKLTGSASISINLFAGVYVELSPPEIPILSDVARFINSIPVVEWAIPDPGKYTWKSDLWRKEWPVANKTKDWDLTRTWKIAGSSSNAGADSVMNGVPPDFAAMVKEVEAEGTGQIPTTDGGPEELKDQSGTGAIGASRAAATAQIANAEREVEREKKWNAKAAEALAARRAKEASSGGGGTPTVHKAGMGAGDEEGKLAEHAAALGQATGSVGNLRQAADRASQGASSNLPTRAEAKAGLDAVANNADKLGDAVTSGTGKFTRPSIAAAPDKAAEAAFEARRGRVQLRVDAAADPVLAEGSWIETQLQICDGCPAIADYRALLDAHGKRFETLSARLDMVENDLNDAWTTALGGDYAAANAKLDKVETQVGWVETETKNLKAQRPKPTWDDRYAAPDGGKLQLRPEFRGIVRETFYPSGYRTGQSATDKTPAITVGGVKYWRFTSPNPSIQPKHPTDKTLWEYDDPRERPTNDHVPAVAVHWSQRGGNNEGQKARANAYNGLAGGIKLVVIPQALNSSLGSGGVSYTPEVTINFRGS